MRGRGAGSHERLRCEAVNRKPEKAEDEDDEDRADDLRREQPTLARANKKGDEARQRQVRRRRARGCRARQGYRRRAECRRERVQERRREAVAAAEVRTAVDLSRRVSTPSSSAACGRARRQSTIRANLEAFLGKPTFTGRARRGMKKGWPCRARAQVRRRRRQVGGQCRGDEHPGRGRAVAERGGG
jgi:hypothetical protein